MKQVSTALFFLAFSYLTSGFTHHQQVTLSEPPEMDTTIIVPVGGNSFVTVKDANSNERVTDEGWKNWKSNKAIFSTFIKVEKAGTLKLSALINVPKGKSKIRCVINDEVKVMNVTENNGRKYIGEWIISSPGYVKINMQGISKTGDLFAELKEFYMSGSAIDGRTAYVKSNEGNYFYWGRRGPSVHLNYDISQAGNEIEWFYNEITVPIGGDPIGSYFMANGFGEGYFGIQVNSSTERRILFSVWSPFNTDDPKQIPDDKKIILLKKGEDVHTGEFGNEGSGGQSYLRYNWKAGTTYKFLLQGKPVEDNYTSYTAYFYAPELKEWLLIANFKRPATHTYLTRLHSFLENFDPSTGHISRKAFYQNQWTRNKDGKWTPISKATFTGDATAQKSYRLDYRGGTENNRFFLGNCGFFNQHTLLKTKFEHAVAAKQPEIDFTSLK
ncbi:DUF3472 domain-containing protein [Terrimonas pollutisoli]|uniref:DUF3472 domain-containing protein n=1 Tax=Terrimonas pollutisoli TaxID=3034147 RepID=UPI0023ECDCAF|nr:DUF3472 domain-containing protein [Terrimonas sp. H1YJ31]